METVNLPSVLPGKLDLVALNQQLRDRTAEINWSLFQKAKDEDLALLLAGLDMGEDEAVLGIDSMSDKIGDRILKLFENRQKTSIPDKETKKSNFTKNISATPANLFTEKFVPATSKNQPGQSKLFETEFVPSFSTEEIDQSLKIEPTNQNTNEQDVLRSSGQDILGKNGQDAQPTALKKDTHFELRRKLV